MKELFGVIKGAAQSDKQKRMFQRLLGVAVVLIFMLVGSMLAVSIVAGEMVKETHTQADGPPTMTNKLGYVVETDETMSATSIFATPALDGFELGRLQFLSFFVQIDGASCSRIGRLASPESCLRWHSISAGIPERRSNSPADRAQKHALAGAAAVLDQGRGNPSR